jgi:pilus assembly protein CpaC
MKLTPLQMFAVGAMAVFSAFPPLMSEAAAKKRSSAASVATPAITLDQGDQKALTVAGEVVRIATADENVVGVNIVPPSGYVLTGKAPGSVMVSVWVAGRSAPAAQYRVTVQPSAAQARAKMGGDLGAAKLDLAGTSLRLSGEFNSLERHAAAAAVLGADKAAPSGGEGANSDAKTTVTAVDASKSAFDVQVQLDVKIVEVSRGKLKSAGFYADRSGSRATVGISGPSNLAAFDTTEGLTSSTGFVPKADAFNLFRWGARSLTVFSALENNGFAYVLAEPSLTAISGQTATFLAGGELPIPLRTGSGADAGITVEFKAFGIRLAMTPTVLDANRMTIQVAPEVSEIDDSLSITVGGLTLPGLRVRRTETTVAAGDGETFVISGLVSQQSASTVDKFPFLGDIPILGAFFRSSRFSRDDKELLMIITPHLVRPFAKTAKLPALPGEEIKDYDPGFLRFLFLENGKFDHADSGFSR